MGKHVILQCKFQTSEQNDGFSNFLEIRVLNPKTPQNSIKSAILPNIPNRVLTR